MIVIMSNKHIKQRDVCVCLRMGQNGVQFAVKVMIHIKFVTRSNTSGKIIENMFFKFGHWYYQWKFFYWTVSMSKNHLTSVA